jgi:hypothetical protein
MPHCTYLKRNATICWAPGFAGGEKCADHIASIPYVMCANGCGRVVSTKHGRPKCTTCDLKGAVMASRARKLAEKTQAIRLAKEKAVADEAQAKADQLNRDVMELIEAA